MDIHGTQKMIAEEHYSYNQYKFSQNYDVFEEFKKSNCRMESLFAAHWGLPQHHILSE